MIGRLKSNWQDFKKSKPGERFKERYYRRQTGGAGHLVARVFWIVLGAAIALGSLLTAPLPGPGFATVLLGLAILSSEVLLAARFLDWAELRLRGLWQSVQILWGTGTPGKVLVVFVAAVLAGTFLWVAYLLLLG